MERDLEILNIGRVPYGEALEFQSHRAEAVIAGEVGDSLILVEHNPVITMGRGGVEKDLHVSEAFLKAKGIGLFWTDRGGMATVHSPGQLVAYPIVRLQEKDLHLYMERMLEAIALTLKEYGLKADFGLHGPGLWVNEAKIASIGVAVKKWVTHHGVSLNVSNDTSLFNFITPCGHRGERITSMSLELGREIDLSEVTQRYVKNFQKVFGYTVRATNFHRPPWLTVRLCQDRLIQPVENLLDDLRLHTVCQEAQCPNKGECYARGTSTFIIMGDVCTRGCRYCAVTKGKPKPLDSEEPEHIAKAVARLQLKHAVVTSVTRDDLADGGASHFVSVIEAIRRLSPSTSVEVLVPDFKGNTSDLDLVCRAGPDMFNHNIETVERLFPSVRPRASFTTSLNVLAYAASKGLRVKSGIMLGLGETWEETRSTIEQLYIHGCRFLTLGQYLAPSSAHVPIARYIAPDEFTHWKSIALNMGFTGVASAPLVRSSYRAEAMIAE